MIRLNREKKKDDEKEKIENRLHSTREYGKFSVEIPLKSEDYLIKHNKSNNISGKNGIITLIYQLEKLEQKDTY